MTVVYAIPLEVARAMLSFVTSSIRRQLIGVLSVVTVVFVAALVVGWSGVGSVAANIGSIAAKEGTLLRATGTSRDLQGSEARALLDRAGIANHLADVAAFRQTLGVLHSYAQAPTARAAVNKLDASFSVWLALDSQVMTLARTGQVARGTRLVIDNVNAAGDQLTGAVAAVGDAIANGDNRTAQATARSSKKLMLAAGVFAALLAAGLGIVITRRLTGGVNRALGRIGDMDRAITENLCPGLEALAAGDLTVSLHAVTTPQTDFPADEIGAILRTTEHLRDSIIVAYDAYNAATERLRSMIGRVSSTAATVGAASQEMSSSSEEAGRATGEISRAVGDVAQGAERQVVMIEAARQSAEDVSRAVNESAQTAREAAEVAHQTRTIAQQGMSAAAQANESMQSVRESSQHVSHTIGGLAAKSEQIGQIVATITGIAEQTNLLALNAAIEAARAGDQGKGFAVVAEEVRKLAEDSQHAAREISQLIGAIQEETTTAVAVVQDGAQRTQTGVEVVEQTRVAFEQIGSSVEDMTARIEQIAAAAQQIAASSSSMQENMTEVAAVAEQSSASTQQVSASTEHTTASAHLIASSAHALSDNAEELGRLVAEFKTNV
jgi:methyl-accepting chemotaxis protein